MKKVKIKVEVIKYMREIYWKDTEIEVPDNISNDEQLMDYFRNNEDGQELYDKLSEPSNEDDSQIDEKDSDFTILEFGEEEENEKENSN